jgi:hypothetical protein
MKEEDKRKAKRVVDHALKVEGVIWPPSKVAKGGSANSQRTLLQFTLFFVFFFFKKKLGAN